MDYRANPELYLCHLRITDGYGTIDLALKPRVDLLKVLPDVIFFVVHYPSPVGISCYIPVVCGFCFITIVSGSVSPHLLRFVSVLSFPVLFPVCFSDHSRKVYEEAT